MCRQLISAIHNCVAVKIHLLCVGPLLHFGTVETTLQKSPPATLLTAPLWSCRKALHNPLSYLFPLTIPASGLLPGNRPLQQLVSPQSTFVDCYSFFTKLAPNFQRAILWELGSWTCLLQFAPSASTRFRAGPSQHTPRRNPKYRLRHTSLQTTTTEFCNTAPSFLFSNKNPNTTKGADSPPKHESERASKASKPSSLFLFFSLRF